MDTFLKVNLLVQGARVFVLLISIAKFPFLGVIMIYPNTSNKRKSVVYWLIYSVIKLLDFYLLGRWKIVPLCQFLNYEWSWASFHMLKFHLYLLFSLNYLFISFAHFRGGCYSISIDLKEFLLLGIHLSVFVLFWFGFFWLCWVFVSVWGLLLVAASGGHSSSWCVGLSLSLPLLLRSTGSRCAGSVVVAHGLICSTACGIFPDQGSNPCPLHWQADSQPLRHQGSPISVFSTKLQLPFPSFLFILWPNLPYRNFKLFCNWFNQAFKKLMISKFCVLLGKPLSQQECIRIFVSFLLVFLSFWCFCIWSVCNFLLYKEWGMDQTLF